MTITRLASIVALSSVIAGPAAAQQPPAPPAPPAPDGRWSFTMPEFTMPDLSQIELPDLSQLELDLSRLQLDLSHLQLPDLGHIQIPQLPQLPQIPFAVDLHAWQVPSPAPQVFVRGDRSGQARQTQSQLDNLYDSARNQIDQNQYDRAIQSLDRIITAGASQAPGAMYWKAYSLARIARRPDALTTLTELRTKFPKSPWIRDAQALEVEVKQASGQAVNADTQSNDDLKLLALRGLMQSDPETALPTVEKMLAGDSSVRVKDRALFLVSQSRSTRGRAIIVGVAKGNANPDLQLRAIRYIGQMGGPEAAQTLDEVYRATSEERVKRDIIRALGNAKAKERLVSLAKGEPSADLRGDAARSLGNMNATAELEQLYKGEQSVEVKKRILQGMQNGNATDKLAAIARSESDPELKRSAIRYLGNARGSAATETLASIYTAESSVEIKKSIIDALGSHDSAAALVTLARAEKNPELKEHIVRRLGNMRDPVARDYLLELLK